METTDKMEEIFKHNDIANEIRTMGPTRQNSSQKPFYMVYAEGKNTPAFKHFNYDDAKKEARRLSEQLGVTCFVLGTISEHKCIKYEERSIAVTEFDWPF